MARSCGYCLDPMGANSRHRIGGTSPTWPSPAKMVGAAIPAYADIFRLFAAPGMYRLTLYAYMRIVICIACRVQLRGAIFLALAAFRICAAPNFRSLLDWRTDCR
jgi:hypothetical protein